MITTILEDILRIKYILCITEMDEWIMQVFCEGEETLSLVSLSISRFGDFSDQLKKDEKKKLVARTEKFNNNPWFQIWQIISCEYEMRVSVNVWELVSIVYFLPYKHFRVDIT